MRLSTLTSAIFVVGLSVGMAGADAPSKKTLTQRPNLVAAQKLAAQARAKLVLGAAEFDADGHAERAMKLLAEVNAELAAAVKAPDAAPK